MLVIITESPIYYFVDKSMKEESHMRIVIYVITFNAIDVCVELV